MKYLVLLAVLVLAYGIWRGPRRSPSTTKQAGPLVPAHDMVPCAHCGVHIPRSEALPAQGHLFCSPAHRQQGPA